MAMDVDEKLEPVKGPISERHLYRNGWGLAVVAFVDKGLVNMHGTAQVLVPHLVGWDVEWESPEIRETPAGHGFDPWGHAEWHDLAKLAALQAAFEAFPTYQHQCNHDTCM